MTHIGARRVSVQLVALGAVIGGTPAWAGSSTGRIAELHVRASDGLQWVIMTTAPSNRPACAANHPYFMIKSEQSDTGKAQFAMLLSAQLSGRVITVDGAGTCTRWLDGEDIDHVQLSQ